MRSEYEGYSPVYKRSVNVGDTSLFAFTDVPLMIRWGFFILLLPVFLSLGCSVGRYVDIQGGPSTATGDFQFSTDVALFQTSQDSIDIVFYIKFPNSSLTFLKDQSSFLAAYDGTITVSTLSGRNVVTKEIEGQIEERSYEGAHSSSDYEYREIRVDLRPGAYSITVTLQDQNSHRKGVVRRILNVAPVPQDRISLSSVVFAEVIEKDSSGGFHIIPNSERIYGERLPELSFYCEVYVPEALDTKDGLIVQYEIAAQRTGNSLLIEDSGRALVLEGLMSHDMAPVTG